MKNCLQLIKISLPILLATVMAQAAYCEDVITITREVPVIGSTKPVSVSIEGFTGEVLDALKFDLYVQGFTVVPPAEATYQISGSNSGKVQGRVVYLLNKQTILSQGYSGTTLRRQAHAFADDIVQAITGKKGIAQTKIAFKVASAGGNGEIYVADFDGRNAQAVTHDNAIVAAPTWAPGRSALYYTSYARNNPDIFYHDLTTGKRRVLAGFSGLNTSAAVSPNGSMVAMILSRGGSPDIWVCNTDGSNLRQLTSTPEDESSPCWSPDGQWICFATRIAERRVLAKVSMLGGPIHRIPTPGAPNPTEPDWSPDGKWIAFTSQTSGFDVCVIPADGSVAPTVLVAGEDPSWAPNSRTLICARRSGGRYVLSVLDVFTKQVKDVPKISGSDSQPTWAR